MKMLGRIVLRFVISAIIASAAIAFAAGSFFQRDGSITAPLLDILSNADDLHGPYKVKRVIDGDTLIVEIDNTETMIRLIGVDTPESVNEVSPEKNCKEGRIASEYTKEKLKGKDVFLEYDIYRTDKFWRTLAYVYLDQEGKHMLQESLLRDGMANVMPVGSNIRYLLRFRIIKADAKQRKAGFWATDFWGTDY